MLPLIIIIISLDGSKLILIVNIVIAYLFYKYAIGSINATSDS